MNDYQKIILDILKVFIKLCDDNDINWYIGGGALIGVFRHGGFIPWDDDIDISMPRQDFDRFCQLPMPDGFALCTRKTNPEWNFALAQFMDKNTEVEISLAKKKRRSYAWIDIFPLDGMPDNYLKRWFRVKNVLLHRYMVQIAFIELQVDAVRNRSIAEKIILSFFKTIPIGKLINTEFVLNHMEAVLKKSIFSETSWCASMLGRYREKEVVPLAWYGKGDFRSFEGISVRVPSEAKKILYQIYGDFMKLPPKEDRVSHNVKILISGR